MRKSKSSGTAEMTTVYKAIESLKSKSNRVIHDPYAMLFLGSRWKKLIKRPFILWIMKQIGKITYPGFRNSIVARVRFMNECIEECFPGNYTQIVILGAGYDMSAFCFRNILSKAMVFEVDHPNTQNRKVAIIKEQIQDIPGNITYVPVDFEKDDLKKALVANGYGLSEKTLFICEGVVCYLDKESVAHTLDFIVNNSARGSKLAFDYLPPDVIDGTSTDRLGKKMRNSLKKFGEPLKFGVTVEDVDVLLKTHRFSDIRKCSTREVQDTYFHGKNKKRTVSRIFNFVCATT